MGGPITAMRQGARIGLLDHVLGLVLAEHQAPSETAEALLVSRQGRVGPVFLHAPM